MASSSSSSIDIKTAAESIEKEWRCSPLSGEEKDGLFTELFEESEVSISSWIGWKQTLEDQFLAKTTLTDEDAIALTKELQKRFREDYNEWVASKEEEEECPGCLRVKSDEDYREVRCRVCDTEMCDACYSTAEDSDDTYCKRCVPEPEEDDDGVSWFDAKYPDAKCRRCDTKVDGESVIYCGGAGGACETWYCGDCYADGTNDCGSCGGH